MTKPILATAVGAAALALFVLASIATGRAIALWVDRVDGGPRRAPWAASEYFGLGAGALICLSVLCGLCWALGNALLSTLF